MQLLGLLVLNLAFATLSTATLISVTTVIAGPGSRVIPSNEFTVELTGVIASIEYFQFKSYPQIMPSFHM